MHQGEEDYVHISHPFTVRQTTLRLCATIDIDVGIQDGPYVMIGSDEYTLDEAQCLLTGLTVLVERGLGGTRHAGR